MLIKIDVTGRNKAVRRAIKREYKALLEDATKTVWIRGLEDDYKSGKTFITFKEV